MEYIIPVALYNVEKKELMGVFIDKGLLSKYLYDTVPNPRSIRTKLSYCMVKKRVIKGTKFNFPITLRAATNEQQKLIQNSTYKIVNGYYEPRESLMSGFDSSKQFLKEEFEIRVNIYQIEAARQRSMQ